MKLPFGRTFLLAFAASLLSLPPASPAQEPTADSPLFHTRSDLVYLPTRVEKKNGDTLHGLTAEQFVVEDNGARQKVQVEAAPDSSGFSIVVLVQCSRTAPAEFPNLQGLGTMIEGIIGEAQHEVAIVSYGDRPYLLGNFSPSPAAARYAISRLKACDESNAAVMDAVGYASRMLRERNNHYRHAILLIGEAKDHGSRSRLEDVVASLGVADAVIYSVAFSPAKDEIKRSFSNAPVAPSKAPARSTGSQQKPSAGSAPEPVYSEGPSHLTLPPQIVPLVDALRQNSEQELAELSGGDYFKFSSKRTFDEDLLRISNQIRNYYLLSFRPSPSGETGLHSLRVTIPDSPAAIIQTRKSYWFDPVAPAPAR